MNRLGIRENAHTILVVDDEPDLAAVVAGTLRIAGFRVITAYSAAEALAAAADSSETIDLLLTDFNLKTMTGLQLAETLRETRPGLRVVFMTGSVAAFCDLSAKGHASLAKPFSFEHLAGFVQSRIEQDES